jgi:hypothetical protein
MYRSNLFLVPTLGARSAARVSFSHPEMQFVASAVPDEDHHGQILVLVRAAVEK